MPGHDGALPNPRGVKLTYDDFVLFPDDGLRHELIDGEHYVTPSPNTKHQKIVLKLGARILDWVEQHRTGEVFVAPFDVVFSQSDVVVPDLIYMSLARAVEIETKVNVRGGPEIVVDWVVDPELDVVRVYRRDDERFARPLELSTEAGDVLTTPLLPGLELRLDDIFRV